MSLFKHKPLRSQKLRDSARGENCTVQAPGCPNATETTVLGHLPDETGTGKMGGKSDDWCACYVDHHCHVWLDSNKDPEQKAWYMRRAIIRTWRRMIERGLIKIQGAKFA